MMTTKEKIGSVVARMVKDSFISWGGLDEEQREQIAEFMAHYGCLAAGINPNCFSFEGDTLQVALNYTHSLFTHLVRKIRATPMQITEAMRALGTNKIMRDVLLQSLAFSRTEIVAAPRQAISIGEDSAIFFDKQGTRVEIYRLGETGHEALGYFWE